METWRVKLYEVFEDQKRDEKPVATGAVSVQGSNVDRVRVAVKELLEKSGRIGGASGRKLRAMSVLADEKQTIAAIISKPRE